MSFKKQCFSTPPSSSSIEKEGTTEIKGEDGFSQTEKVSHKAIVQALAPFLRTEKRTVAGVEKEYTVRKCPSGTHCKNVNAEIRYISKSGFKNPQSHLRICLCKVRILYRHFQKLILLKYNLSREMKKH